MFLNPLTFVDAGRLQLRSRSPRRTARRQDCGCARRSAGLCECSGWIDCPGSYAQRSGAFVRQSDRGAGNVGRFGGSAHRHRCHWRAAHLDHRPAVASRQATACVRRRIRFDDGQSPVVVPTLTVDVKSAARTANVWAYTQTANRTIPLLAERDDGRGAVVQTAFSPLAHNS